MFEFLYSKNKVNHLGRLIQLKYQQEKEIVPLLWTEHCIECAAPKCYGTCPRYKSREDGNCIRIVNAITPVMDDGELCVKTEFRSWAKIESQLKVSTLPAKGYVTAYKRITRLGYLFEKTARRCPVSSVSKFIYDGWFSYRQKYINYLIREQPKQERLALKGLVANNDQTTSLLIDVKSSSKLLFRESVEIPLGETEFNIPIPSYENKDTLYFINIHPANAEQHVTLLFKKLQLVPKDITDGKKVKCVIWDLDNTLWDGVLIEEKNVKPRQEFIELIQNLDSCGIVNSIASKNNQEEVDAKLRELGIADYFVFKKVNWDPKSVNISKTIRQMNINPNTIVFVDDNPFERNEVSLEHPSLTCVDPSEIMDFAKCKRFNVVVTEDSKNRRHTYEMLESMKTEEEAWDGNIDDFLMNCHIKVKLSKPTDDNIMRCFELLQRTNQLNSSGRRLSLDEVKQIVSSETYDTYVLNSSDKFGDYGIVGFMIVEKQDDGAHITDFVISCRVANKKIEPTIVNYLAQKYKGQVFFHYKKTLLNGPMFKMVEELNMEKSLENNEHTIYAHKYKRDYPRIVEMEEKEC